MDNRVLKILGDDWSSQVSSGKTFFTSDSDEENVSLKQLLQLAELFATQEIEVDIQKLPHPGNLPSDYALCITVNAVLEED